MLLLSPNVPGQTVIHFTLPGSKPTSLTLRVGPAVVLPTITTGSQ
jgi:hypothetical protein